MRSPAIFDALIAIAIKQTSMIVAPRRHVADSQHGTVNAKFSAVIVKAHDKPFRIWRCFAFARFHDNADFAVLVKRPDLGAYIHVRSPLFDNPHYAECIMPVNAPQIIIFA